MVFARWGLLERPEAPEAARAPRRTPKLQLLQLVSGLVLALALGTSGDLTGRTAGPGEATGDKAAMAKVEARVSLCKMAA